MAHRIFCNRNTGLLESTCSSVCVPLDAEGHNKVGIAHEGDIALNIY